MRSAAIETQQSTVISDAGSDTRKDADHSTARNDDISPVHNIHARLEDAAFASFSTKESTLAPRTYRVRTIALIIGAAIGGWALLISGIALKIL